MTSRTTGGSALSRGLGLAADTVSAPVFLGFAGAVFAFGYDGLAFGLGLAGGLAFLALVLAPSLAKLEARSVPAFLAARFDSRAVGILAAIIVVAAAFILLVAQVAGAGLVMSRLVSVEPALAVAIGAVVLLFGYLISAARPPVAAGVTFLVMCLVFLAVAAALSVKAQGPMPPPPVFATALATAQGMEEGLIEEKLADPRSFKAIALPFLTLNPWNFTALLISLMAGCAVLPAAIRRLSFAADAEQAQRSALWGVTCVALFLIAVPAVAVFAKLDVYRLVGAATKLTELPDWVFALGKAGLVQVCGQDAIDVNTVVSACSRVSGQSGILRLQDLSIVPDAIVLSAPAIAGLPPVVTYAALAGALLASMAGAVALLGVIVSAFGQRDDAAAGPWPAKSLTLGGVALLAATAAALTGPGDLVTLFAWGVSLAAAGLFPAMIAGLFWRRANSWAVLAAMAAGAGVTLYYIVATRYFAPQFFTTWSFLSNASFTAIDKFELLQQAAEAAPGGPAAIAYDYHAQTIANWWGIKNIAAGIFGLPLGLLIAAVVSLMLPGRAPREPAETDA